MAQNIILKRSAVEGKIPLGADLDLGELAINSFDGKIYLKKDNGAESIVEVGAGSGGDYLEGVPNDKDLDLGTGDLLSSGATIGNVIYPITDGVEGQVLTTDGSGNLTFKHPESNIANDSLSVITADTETTTEGTFFISSTTTVGIIASDVITSTFSGGLDGVNPFLNDIISEISTDRTVLEIGQYTAELSIELDGSETGDNFFWVEIYVCDVNGVVSDSGTGDPNGSLGVPTIAVLTSGATRLIKEGVTIVNASGFILNLFEVSANQRLRIRILSEKVGSDTPRTLTINVGQNIDSFFQIPVKANLNDLADVDTTGVVSGNILKFDGTNWIPAVDTGGGGGITGTLGAIDGGTFTATNGFIDGGTLL